ncbi:hypothetical protein BDB01DRAFT_807206 [Pilobolus umbonatus]|nr:hypothetical protein BDB01DRAFT_807206 [Pilobolus umbonatus]
MSRIIVKNLPKLLTEEKFREHFSKKGEVTDAKLMKTSWGTSRRFGFIGYKTEEAANAAIDYFNNTYINTSRIVVEKAIAYKSEDLPRAWSKYSEGSSAFQRIKGPSGEFTVEVSQDDHRKEREAFLNELNADKQDPKLKEYLDVMTARSKSKTWANDESQLKEEETVKVDYVGSDDELYDDLPPKNKESAKDEIEEKDEDTTMDTETKIDTIKDTAAEETTNDTDMNVNTMEDLHRDTKDTRQLIEDTGRLFIRNLPYACTEEDLRSLFGQYGTLSEVHMPIAKDTKKSKGYAYILYLLPDDAIKAFEALDMKPFQGRLLHVLPAQEKPASKEEEILGLNGTKLSSVKKEKEKKRRNMAGQDFNWNSLYMSADAIAESIADRLGVSKSEVLNPDANNMAVRLALAETQIVTETKEFFEKHGIVLDSFGKKDRSDTVILVKNIPYGTTEDDLRELFGKYGELGRILVPPAKTMGVVEFLEPSEARNAFKSLAYRRYKDSLIYLEKAPNGLFRDRYQVNEEDKKNKKEEKVKAEDLLVPESTEDVTSLFVKNLSFGTTIESLRNAFKGITGYRSSRINVKSDPKNPGKTLSMGYGFIEFNSKDNAEKALKAMQGYMLDGHALELKMSNRKHETATQSRVPDTTKLVVRNVPFEATDKDLRELFGTYGQLKSLRMPKKFNGGHRGFAFIDFVTKQEAKNVYEQMSNIHLYGRHLVLEWAEDEEGVDALREKTGKHFVKDDGRVNKKQRVNLDEDEDMLE